MGWLELVWHIHSLYVTVLAYGTNLAPNKEPGAEVLSEGGSAVEIGFADPKIHRKYMIFAL